MTMSFSTHRYPVTLDPLGREVLANVPVRPLPTYPLEARRRRWSGVGLYVMRFRPDGSVEKVVALKSTGQVTLDNECIRTLQKWRCRPGIYRSAYVPISFNMR